ncbi:hypothetical protein [Streptomyces sp. cmx-10-25]|uniref:hypothetical protein n=1 Tax=Streptomyces sp. cmx-10-25 TaxID=2790919 RepID=UPI003980B67B
MNSTDLEDEDTEYEVTLRFRPDGPAVLGVWSKPETAETVFMEWLGLYGQVGTVLTFTATSNGETRPVKGWTYEGGLRVTGTA